MRWITVQETAARGLLLLAKKSWFTNGQINKETEMNTLLRSYAVYLGLFITENLTWHVQIHSLRASLSKIYYTITSLRNITST
jgi:hypothetical protein